MTQACSMVTVDTSIQTHDRIDKCKKTQNNKKIKIKATQQKGTRPISDRLID